MTDGLKDSHREAIIAAIAANDRVERAVLFGSRATGTHSVSSDVDIALIGDGLTLTDHARLAAALDEIPMAHSVDLVLHDSIQNRTLLAHIGRDGVELYRRPSQSHDDQPKEINGAEIEDWIERPFEDVIDFREGPGILAKDFREDGNGIPLIRLAGLDRGASILQGCDYLSPEAVESRWGHFRLALGDVLLSTSASLGRIAVVRQEAVGAIPYTGIIRMRPKDGRLYAPFIRYLLEGPGFQRQAEMLGAGSVIRHFGPTHLRQMTIPVPSLSEQRAIAHVLGTLDDKIELNRRMNATLEAMARALFKSWFVDFDPVRAKMEGWDTGLPNDIADLFPDRLVDSELGEMPEGWDVGVLDDAVELLSGGTPRTSVAHYWNGDIPWYTAKDAPPPSDVFVVATDRTITQAGVDNSSTIVLPPRTTVISARGTVGRLACLGRPMAMNQTCYGIRGSGGYQDFFTYWLVRKSVEELRSRTHGTIFDTITRQTFAFVSLPMPPVSVAEAFECAVTPIMERILSNLHQASAFAALRDALLPRMVSGGLRTHDVEPSREERSHV